MTLIAWPPSNRLKSEFFMRTRPKYLIAALCGMMILVVCAAGCTSSNTSPSPSAQAASGVGSASVSKNASTAVQNSSEHHEAVDISVHYVGSPQSFGPFNTTPRDGYKWWVYNVTIKDINVTDYLVSESNFALNTSNGTHVFTDYVVNYTETLGWNNGSVLDTHLRPGETASGKIVFAVPENVSPQTIEYLKLFDGYGDLRTFDALAK